MIDLITEKGKILRNIELREALEIAKKKNLDLIKVSNSLPGKKEVYKIYKINFYKKKKTYKKRKTKIIKMSIRIFKNDYLNKIKLIKKIILKNDVKVVLNLRGKEKIQKDNIISFYDQLFNDLKSFCNVRKIINSKINLYSLMLYEKKN